jgi:hypothetical protein
LGKTVCSVALIGPTGKLTSDIVWLMQQRQSLLRLSQQKLITFIVGGGQFNAPGGQRNETSIFATTQGRIHYIGALNPIEPTQTFG